MQIYKHLSDKKLNDFEMCQLLQRCTKNDAYSNTI